MIGRIEETSASFEARSASRSYPTIAEPAPADVRRSGRGSISFAILAGQYLVNLGQRNILISLCINPLFWRTSKWSAGYPRSLPLTWSDTAA